MRIVAPLIVFALVVFTACSAPVAPTDSSDTSGSVTIRMPASGFDPETLTVKTGTKVCFVNEDPEARWPASNIHPTHEIYSEFDPATPVPSGETWCFTFDKPGIWQFHDHLYPEFTGRITVE
ncbi:MAG: cupredoxin domain-containing protein [Candidatus Peribacteraceae bacterium]|nr:cupredoxin domain-containing protein [Candidatus Peribacteraceae bacterium]MBP9850901.1 cupredoxin domain-containing protein [Candidatus Peribacteraceae bacterium]